MDDLGHLMQRNIGRFIGQKDEPDDATRAPPPHIAKRPDAVRHQHLPVAAE
jgi:hypothetical protein